MFIYQNKIFKPYFLYVFDFFDKITVNSISRKN